MSAWRQAEDAIDKISAGQGKLLSHAERPWSSPTFEGTYQTLTLTYEGDDGVLIGAAIIEYLPSCELKFGSYLLCEAKIMWINRQVSPSPRLDMQLQLLLVERHKELA